MRNTKCNKAVHTQARTHELTVSDLMNNETENVAYVFWHVYTVLFPLAYHFSTIAVAACMFINNLYVIW